MSFTRGTRGFLLIGILAIAAFSRPNVARAEVALLTEDMFIVRHTGVVGVDAGVSWDALMSPADWWSGAHSFSGDAENFVLDARAGGCFCEMLPANADRSEPGSVKHLEVLFVDPGKAIRLAGALGPLQSEPVRGVLTITLKPVENGTRILFEYAVGGPSRFEQDAIAPAVDGVIGEQLARLVDLLGEAGSEIDARAIPSFVPEPSGPARSDGDGMIEDRQSGSPDRPGTFGAETRAVPSIENNVETAVEAGSVVEQGDSAVDQESGTIGSDFLSR